MTANYDYALVANPDVAYEDAAYIPYGAARELMYYKGPECIIGGPAETGKTLAACWKLHILALKYPGAQFVIARAIQADLWSSVLQTWEKVIVGAPIERYGGAKPERYIYPNGSVVWTAGLDKPGKVLSSEKDIIYVNQAEELKEDSWETITTRVTGRGAVMPYTQAIGDANPAGSKHWILRRASTGALKLLYSKHLDNPTLYTRDGVLTKQGERTMETLNALTGIRQKRLRDGLWVTAEGAVYDIFDHSVHVKKRDPAEFTRYRIFMDEGYTNPAVILLVGEDSDGRWHVQEEWYRTGKLQERVIEKAREIYLSIPEDKRSDVACDAAAAGLIAGLRNAGLPVHGEKGRVLDGIYAIQNRLQVQGDDRPRLTVDPSCTDLINEFESYVWKPGKDEPVKDFDHGLDALRYGGAGQPSWIFTG